LLNNFPAKFWECSHCGSESSLLGREM
jgi:hypothetical protein